MCFITTESVSTVLLQIWMVSMLKVTTELWVRHGHLLAIAAIATAEQLEVPRNAAGVLLLIPRERPLMVCPVVLEKWIGSKPLRLGVRDHEKLSQQTGITLVTSWKIWKVLYLNLSSRLLCHDL